VDSRGTWEGVLLAQRCIAEEEIPSEDQLCRAINVRRPRVKGWWVFCQRMSAAWHILEGLSLRAAVERRQGGFGHRKIALRLWVVGSWGRGLWAKAKARADADGSTVNTILSAAGGARNFDFFSFRHRTPSEQASTSGSALAYVDLVINSREGRKKRSDAAQITLLVFRKATTLYDGIANANGRRHAHKGKITSLSLCFQ